MLKIDIINETRENIRQSDLEKYVKAVYCLLFEDIKKSHLEISFVSKVKIAKLNKQYLHHLGPTDVLSFPNADHGHTPIKSIGSVVICPKYLIEHQENIKEVILHGMIHLAGYDHVSNPKEWDLKIISIKNELPKI